jgi:aldehyde oxidoreductase
MMICDPEKDTLASVIRRIGLTGTKVGCGTGVCGACSVILNGKLVRSCTVKIRNVEQYSSVTTIEGIGTADHLHPFRGFHPSGSHPVRLRTPGFIVSSYALLKENPTPPARSPPMVQEALERLPLHRYKPIVDAVMAAARVMRASVP